MKICQIVCNFAKQRNCFEVLELDQMVLKGWNLVTWLRNFENGPDVLEILEIGLWYVLTNGFELLYQTSVAYGHNKFIFGLNSETSSTGLLSVTLGYWSGCRPAYINNFINR